MTEHRVDPYSDFCDAHGKMLFGTGPDFGTVIFVDPTPNANWAHPCVYIFCYDGDMWVMEHDWPPGLPEEEKKVDGSDDLT